MGERLRDTYQSKGFRVNLMTMKNGVRIKFDKNCGGINMLLGLGKGITAVCTKQGDSLVVNYSDGDWVGKIVGLAVGWLMCLIPFITALVGLFGQFSLPKEINDEIMVIINS